MTEDEKYILLDKYIKGNLNESELIEFNKVLESDSSFANEVLETKELSDLMNDLNDENELRNQLKKHHNIVQVQKSKSLSIWTTIGIAASFSILAIFSSLFIQGYYNKTQTPTSPIQELSSYQNLTDDVNEIQTNQENLEAKIQEIEEKINVGKSPNGTCFPINRGGLFITNFHVVKNAKSIKVSSSVGDKVEYNAKILYHDRNKDIAILSIDDTNFVSFTRIPFALTKRELKLSESLYTLGFPKKDIVYGQGNVSSTSGYKSDSTKFEVSIPVNPGNSGSPVFDKQGYVVGLIDSKNKNKVGTSYVIKTEYISSVMDSISNDYPEITKIFSQRNRIKWKKREDQVNDLTAFIFKVKVVK